MERRAFVRPYGDVVYRRVFVIAGEGKVSENEYFRQFANLDKWGVAVKIELPRNNHKSAPHQVLKTIQTYLTGNPLRRGDQAWIVVDMDTWQDSEIQKLYDWAKSNLKQFGIAVSNPQFEYWLLLHYEDGNGIKSSDHCITRLKKWLPNYDKTMKSLNFTQGSVFDAIDRAKKRNCPECRDWPRNIGQTTVYKLVEQIINA
jgi:hypothetical protein